MRTTMKVSNLNRGGVSIVFEKLFQKINNEGLVSFNEEAKK